MSTAHGYWRRGGIRKFMPSVWYWHRPAPLTCPTSCPLADNICYATRRPGSWRREAIQGLAARALESAPDVRQLPDGAVARLHVSGDFGDPDHPMEVDRTYVRAIATGLRARPDVRAWTYTHGWRAWASGLRALRRRMRIFASCDTPDDVREAVRRGWPVSYHAPDVDLGASYHMVGGQRLLVCPEMCGRSRCGECMACYDVPRRVAGIAFRNH